MSSARRKLVSVPVPIVPDEAIAAEIALLEHALLGHIKDNRAANGAVVDAAECLARDARASRPAMKAAVAPRVLNQTGRPAASMRPASMQAFAGASVSIQDAPDDSLTNRFNALKS